MKANHSNLTDNTQLGANGDHMDKTPYGIHTGSLGTHIAKAEASQPDPRYAKPD